MLEPWGGFLPDQVARLSFRQVRHLFLKPAMERVDKAKADQAGHVHVPDDRPPTFAEFVAGIGVHTPPGTDLDRMYAKYLAGWEKQHGGHQRGDPGTVGGRKPE